jgi:hypothetical protein
MEREIMTVHGIVNRVHHMMQLFHEQKRNFARKVQLLYYRIGWLVRLGWRKNHVNKVLQNIRNMQRNLKRNATNAEKRDGTELQYF